MLGTMFVLFSVFFSALAS